DVSGDFRGAPGRAAPRSVDSHPGPQARLAVGRPAGDCGHGARGHGVVNAWRHTPSVDEQRSDRTCPLARTVYLRRLPSCWPWTPAEVTPPPRPPGRIS